MKSQSEPIARRANAEDHCKGRFWDDSFRVRARVTAKERALTARMRDRAIQRHDREEDRDAIDNRIHATVPVSRARRASYD